MAILICFSIPTTGFLGDNADGATVDGVGNGNSSNGLREVDFATDSSSDGGSGWTNFTNRYSFDKNGYVVK